MCLIALALNEHADYPFILIANRDEFYERPSSAAHFWPEHETMLAGKDLKAGGTWLGVTTRGRFAALTNYRDLNNLAPLARSRGELPIGFLTSRVAPEDYLENLKNKADQYNGFNLLTYADKHAFHFSNYQGDVNPLPDGIHGLSNALLDTPWPKVEKVKGAFKEALFSDISEENFLQILADQSVAEDDDLPQTGLPYALEKAVSAVCIRTENYGTCCSTIVMISRGGLLTFIEKSYAVGGRPAGIKRFSFKLS